MEMSFIDGFLSDYDDSGIWIEKAEKDATAIQIDYLDKEHTRGNIHSGRIKDVVFFNSNDNSSYIKEIERIKNEGYDATGEFILDGSIAYIGMNYELEEIEDASLSFTNVYFC